MHADDGSWAQRSLPPLLLVLPLQLPVLQPPSLLLPTTPLLLTPLLEPPLEPLDPLELEPELELDVPSPVPATRPEQAMATTPPSVSRIARISPRSPSRIRSLLLAEP